MKVIRDTGVFEISPNLFILKTIDDNLKVLSSIPTKYCNKHYNLGCKDCAFAKAIIEKINNNNITLYYFITLCRKSKEG